MGGCIGSLRFRGTEYLPAGAAGTIKWDCDEIMVWCVECIVDSLLPLLSGCIILVDRHALEFDSLGARDVWSSGGTNTCLLSSSRAFESCFS